MEFEPLVLAGVVKIKPRRLGDGRGYFAEVFRDAWFRETIADVTFVQDNQALSRHAGTVRGLHFQLEPMAQGKLVRCDAGSIFDVAVDIRAGSPTFGRWTGVELSARNGDQLWVPPGFAHGYATLEPDTMIHYKVTAPYSPPHDRGLQFDDPAIGITWPVDPASANLSPRDRAQPKLSELPVCFTYSQKAERQEPSCAF